jgi:hypothetical protein
MDYRQQASQLLAKVHKYRDMARSLSDVQTPTG